MGSGNGQVDRRGGSAGWWCGVVAGLLVILAAWPFILGGNVSGRGASDDLRYHWPAIVGFAEELPTPDLSDYASATTPGYHLELAVVRWLGAGRMFVQLYASFWTVFLIGVLGWIAGNSYGRAGVFLVLPLVASMYVLFPGIWLLPDNAGWFGVLVLLILALDYPASVRTMLAMGVVLGLLVLVRQVHVWAAALIWIVAWVGDGDDVPGVQGVFGNFGTRSRRLLIGVIAAVPAALILVWFVRMWGGLVPPRFQGAHQGPNVATPGFILLQVCVLSVFFAPVLWGRFVGILKSHWSWLLGAAVAGLVVGLVPASGYDAEAGRYSGWWNVIGKTPVVGDRSVVFVLGSVGGAVAAVVWGSLVSRRDVWILGVGLVGFVAAQSANHASWQRYHEPMLLMVGVLILSRSGLALSMKRRVVFGCVVLAGVFGLITATTLMNAEPVEGVGVMDEVEMIGEKPEIP